MKKITRVQAVDLIDDCDLAANQKNLLLAVLNAGAKKTTITVNGIAYRVAK
jgi:hypothetical protein